MSTREGEAGPVRASWTVGLWTAVSRLVGLTRVLIFGAVLGPTFFANIFQAGYVLPNTVFTVMAGPVLEMVVIPTLVRAVAGGGTALGALVLGKIAGRLLGLAAACAGGLVLLSVPLAWLLVAAVPPAEQARGALLGAILIAFVAPQVVLYAVVGLAVAAQQSRGRFALAAASPCVESLGTIATVLGAVAVFGPGPEIDHAPVAMVVLLGVGNTVSVLAHAGLQVFGAARVGLLTRPRPGWRADPDARDALRRIVRSVPVAAGPAATGYGVTLLAATVPGGVMVVQLSYQVFYALSYVGARAVSMTALPRLSRASAEGDRVLFAGAWRMGLFYAAIAALLPMCLLALLAAPTADLLANGELRRAGLIAGLTACLVVVAFAQFLGGLHDYGRQALYSRLDDRGPRAASLLAAAMTALVAASTLLIPSAEQRPAGLVVALLVGECVGAATVLSRVRSGIRPETMTDRRSVAIAAAAAGAALSVGAASRLAFDVVGLSRPAELAWLLGCGLVSAIAYAAVVLVLRRALRPSWSTTGDS
ncbi:MAG TPA: lipid II flippase MurJ [Pseudonocardia sp.]